MSNLWIFGSNYVGELGDGTIIGVFIPKRNTTAPIQENESLISSTYNFSDTSVIIRKASPYLLTTGSNSNGQLGINITDGYSNIFQIPVLSNPSPFIPVKASGGFEFILLLAADGKLYGSGVGINGLGRLDNSNNK